MNTTMQVILICSLWATAALALCFVAWYAVAVGDYRRYVAYCATLGTKPALFIPFIKSGKEYI